ncbi:hypothetical protein [Roseivivax marinus]|uniref:hypothetical protein n=1 Tax=Roseivivax marinus TaxID=1379903 RepID=UPI00273E8CE8|nr:hypothetical protein [Roseivivax marinus]
MKSYRNHRPRTGSVQSFAEASVRLHGEILMPSRLLSFLSGTLPLVVFGLQPYQATAQNDFCAEAVTRIPYTQTNAVSIDDVTRNTWESSLNQEFTTYSEFEDWSQENDGGSSYKLFSLSYGSESNRSSGSFAESYALYSRSYESALSEYRYRSGAERYPSTEYINNVLARCVQKPLFAVISPGQQLITFNLTLKIIPPILEPVVLDFVAAECRDERGRYQRSITTEASSPVLDCRRTNPDQEQIAISAGFDSATVVMPTIASKFEILERQVARQNAQTFDLIERIEILEKSLVGRIDGLGSRISTLNEQIDKSLVVLDRNVPNGQIRFCAALKESGNNNNVGTDRLKACFEGANKVCQDRGFLGGFISGPFQSSNTSARVICIKKP